MYKKGGYQIIDLQNKELEVGVGISFPGIYDLIEGSNKAVLVSGINVPIAGLIFTDWFSSAVVNENTFEISLHGGIAKLVVSDDDFVTFYSNQ